MQRIQGRLGDAHVQGPSFFLTTTLHDFGPLLLLPVGAAVAGWFARRRGKQPSPYDLTCPVVWSLTAPILATASLSKLPWYVYLSYPGIALLLAVSAQGVAQAVSGWKAVQTAALAACAAVLIWRLRIDDVWPAKAQYRGVAGRLWELAGRNPDVVLVPGPAFRLTRQYGPAGREARLLLRMLLRRQSRDSAKPVTCRGILVNHRDPSALDDTIELRRPLRRNIRSMGLYLIDDCGGRLRKELTRRAHRR